MLRLSYTLDANTHIQGGRLRGDSSTTQAPPPCNHLPLIFGHGRLPRTTQKLKSTANHKKKMGILMKGWFPITVGEYTATEQSYITDKLSVCISNLTYQ